VLVKYESNGNHVGDADSEALGKLQEELTAQMEVEIEKLRTELTMTLKEYSEKQEKEIHELQNSVNSSHDSLTAFQHTLKEEIEFSKESSKR
jgi:predicted  nucleic acid-binding Zn-ribbon protein